MTVLVTPDERLTCCGARLNAGGFCAYCRSRYDLGELERLLAYARYHHGEVNARAEILGYLTPI